MLAMEYYCFEEGMIKRDMGVFRSVQRLNGLRMI
jgi:hypothetical protein